GDDRIGDLSDRDIAHEYPFHDTASNRIGFDAQGPVQARAVHAAAFRENVAGASGYFAADGHAAVAVFHRAVPDDHVFHSNADTTAVVVAPRLQRDAIVAGIEGAPFDEHVAARFRIASIIVRPVSHDGHVTHGDIGRQDGVDLPHRRIPDGDALDQDVLAAV